MQSPVHAPILQRKHSTAHYFQNGTVYILGGIGPNATATTDSFGPSIITLRLDKKNLSLHSSVEDSGDSQYPNVVGHTSHVHDASNAIISVLGLPLLQAKEMAPPLIAIPSLRSFSSNDTTLPYSRYLHTSVLINDTLHVVGGQDAMTHALVDDVIWNYSFSTATWSTPQRSNIPGLSGHITIAYHQWLVSCFGTTANGSLTSQCTWFDTTSLNITQMDNSHIAEWPTARKYASMISQPDHEANFVLFGGQNKSAVLDDVWYLDIRAPFEMGWSKINTLTNHRRSAHASTLIDKDVILYYGGQDSLSSLATDPIYFNVTNKEWIHAGNNQYRGPETGLGVDSDTNASDRKSNSGAIAGSVIGIVCIAGLVIAYFAWRTRHQRRQKLRDSRAVRFSQSPSSHQQQADAEQLASIHYPLNNEKHNNKLQGAGQKEGVPNSVTLPESVYHNNNRISKASFATEYHSILQENRYSHLSAASNVVESPHAIPKIEFMTPNTSSTEKNSTMEPITEGKSANYKRRESTGFNRLTLNLFSNNNSSSSSTDAHQDTKKGRASSLFQLRSSRLLQPNTPTSPNMKDSRHPHKQSRYSLSAKSVSSVQWVGFNDTMDAWRRSTGSSLHLAVTNARSSMYLSDSSTQSTPRSPMFPQHLKDNAMQHQMSKRDSTKSTPGPTKRSTATSGLSKDL